MKDTEQFLREFNQAWAREDTAAILDGVTDDIEFAMVGETGIRGREAFALALDEMTGSGNQCTLELGRVIVNGTQAAVDGDIRVKGKDGKQTVYAFCDLYELRDGKISSIKAYVVEKK